MDEAPRTPPSREPPEQPTPPYQPITSQTPPPPQVPPAWGYASPPPPAPDRLSSALRARKLVVGLGVAAGVAIAASAVAVAAASSNPTAPAPASTQASSGSSNTPPTPPAPGPGMFRFRGGLGGLGGFGIGGGPLLYGTFTVQGPNGPETLAVRTGTVSDISNTSGSTWTLTVKSTDGTSGTFTVDSQTSVNGGETGIASVKQGDTVRVVAVVSGTTSTAKQVTDETVLKANGSTWLPMGPKPPAPDGSSGTSTQSGAPPV